ncbi:MAG: hypothetical protein A3D13_02840 [Planctomycetes bacterium RIFCSPHIGHO2_02_FULL_40_12]|nr:MAG: hypothetical protein A3D13_02840 [Planctomycetes bacterium RIFCSPHIGHO2_02_FULL_40_12]
MLHSVRGVFDGKRLELEEKVSVKGKTDVLVTFLNEDKIVIRNKFALKRLLERKPVKVAPLKVKELIEEGRR